MTQLEYAQLAGCARINEAYELAVKEGVTLTLSDNSEFKVSTKESLIDYKIVADGYKDGMFIADKLGRMIYDHNLMLEVVDLMGTWGIAAFNKRVLLQLKIRACKTIEEILEVQW